MYSYFQRIFVYSAYIYEFYRCIFYTSLLNILSFLDQHAAAALNKVK